MRYEGRTAACLGTPTVPLLNRANTPTSVRVTELNGVGVLAHRGRNMRTCALFGAAGYVCAAVPLAWPSATASRFHGTCWPKLRARTGFAKTIVVEAGSARQQWANEERPLCAYAGSTGVSLRGAANEPGSRLYSIPSDERPLASQVATGWGLRTRQCRGECNISCWRAQPGRRARISRKTDVL